MVIPVPCSCFQYNSSSSKPVTCFSMALTVHKVATKHLYNQVKYGSRYDKVEQQMVHGRQSQKEGGLAI